MPGPGAGLGDIVQAWRLLRVAVGVIVERVELEAAGMAFGVASVAAEPLMVRALGVVKDRFALAGQGWFFRTAQGNRSQYLAGLDIDDLNSVEQVIGDSDRASVIAKRKRGGPAVDINAAHLVRAELQRYIDEIARLARAPGQ